MQINDVNVGKLQSMGIITSPQDLLSNSCLNIQAGAWILILQQSGVTWECLGSYNAGHTIKNKNLHLEYARNIFKIHTTLKIQLILTHNVNYKNFIYCYYNSVVICLSGNAEN